MYFVKKIGFFEWKTTYKSMVLQSPWVLTAWLVSVSILGAQHVLKLAQRAWNVSFSIYYGLLTQIYSFICQSESAKQLRV